MRALQVLIACFALVVTTARSDACDTRATIALFVAGPAGAPPPAGELSFSLQATRAPSRVSEHQQVSRRNGPGTRAIARAGEHRYERRFLRHCALLC
jgi:hypothetical protein